MIAVLLVLVVCAVEDGSCLSVPVEHPSFSACHVAALTVGAEWLRHHPGYRIEKAVCVFTFHDEEG